jgi:hypothetical protein
MLALVAALAGCASSAPQPDFPPLSGFIPIAPTAADAPEPRAGASRVSEAAGKDQTTTSPRVSPPVDPPTSIHHYAFQDPLPEQWLASTTAAMVNGNLSATQCRAAAQKLGDAVTRAGQAASGVATPMRVAGTIGRVRFITPPKSVPYGVMDCRLVVLLEPFAKVLAEHGVIAAHIGSSYRPRAHIAGKRKPSQHSYGLALDIMALTFDDGLTVELGRDWQGAVGEPVCGPEAKLEHPTPAAVRLRDVACAVARAGIFHRILTPNYNAAHASHFHFDIARDVKYFVVR